MKVERIALSGFRNYDQECVEFSGATNVIKGENGQGKTNLLEAVYMLTCGRSFRTRLDRELVGFGFSNAEILADTESHGREQTIKIVMTPGQRKQITVNAVKKSASELSGGLNSVLFCPDDLYLIREGAAERRRFLDECILQLRPRYAQALQEYRRLHEHKTRILRDSEEKPSLLDALDEFSYGMARAGAVLIHYRAHFIRRLQETAPAIHADFSGAREALALRYETVSTVTDPLASPREIFPQLLRHQEAHRAAEIACRTCLSGPHKDDLAVEIDGQAAKTYSSQGQTRTAALSLKLAARDIFQADTGEWPVLLLDDVLSELDKRRQEFVLNRIRGGQTFITCCEDDRLSSLLKGRVFHVREGAIV